MRTCDERVLGLPQPAVQALREHHKRQAADRLTRVYHHALATGFSRGLPGLRGRPSAGGDHRAGRDPDQAPGPVRRGRGSDGAGR
jgi:hypothetical protein